MPAQRAVVAPGASEPPGAPVSPCIAWSWVSIACALLKDVPIVLLDEAAAALDVGGEQAIGDAFAAVRAAGWRPTAADAAERTQA